MKAIDLFHAWSPRFTRDRAPLTPSPEAKVLLALMDHYNDLHFHVRNAIRDSLKAGDARNPKRSTAVHEPEYGGREAE